MRKIKLDGKKTLTLATETVRALGDDALHAARGAYSIPTIPVMCHHSAVRSTCCPP